MEVMRLAISCTIQKEEEDQKEEDGDEI